MTGKPPRLPLDVLSYWEDTRGLSAAEHGVYLNLLLLAWRYKEGIIPNNMKEIRRFFKSQLSLHGRSFNALVPKILRKYFEPVENGDKPGEILGWKQGRLSKTREKVVKIFESKTKSS